jgi:sirohydrochlorin cobaltochelatase
MAGDEENSWKSNFERIGLKVYPVLIGLGSNNEFVQIFIDHIKDAAKEANINLQ